MVLCVYGVCICFLCSFFGISGGFFPPPLKILVNIIHIAFLKILIIIEPIKFKKKTTF